MLCSQSQLYREEINEGSITQELGISYALNAFEKSIGL